MEGTRHEKIALIVIAYVIGFTSAFIAFGVNKIESQSKIVPLETQSALEAQSSNTHHSDLSVGVGEDGLYVITADGERLISANKNVFAANTISSSETPGFYYSMIEAEASRDGQFIYYCEQLSETQDHCDPYVYVVADDTIHPVTHEGGRIKPLILAHDSTWTDDNMLMVSGASSISQTEPWSLGTPSALPQ